MCVESVAMANAVGDCGCFARVRTIPDRKRRSPEPQATPLDEVDSVARNEEFEAFSGLPSLWPGAVPILGSAGGFTCASPKFMVPRVAGGQLVSLSDASLRSHVVT